jgi:hypothetical protein
MGTFVLARSSPPLVEIGRHVVVMEKVLSKGQSTVSGATVAAPASVAPASPESIVGPGCAARAGNGRRRSRASTPRFPFLGKNANSSQLLRMASRCSSYQSPNLLISATPACALADPLPLRPAMTAFSPSINSSRQWSPKPPSH